MQTNWKKMNKNWDFLNPNSSMYNFPELCGNCSKNIIYSFSGASGAAGVSGHMGIIGPSSISLGASGLLGATENPDIIVMDDIKIPLFRRVLAQIKSFCNIVWYNNSVRKILSRRIKNDKND